MIRRDLPLILLCLSFILVDASAADYTHPFQNPDLPPEQRIDNLLSLLTLDEKVECLSTNPTIERLGLKGAGHVEGLHGLAQGGPGRWGRDRPIPTTTFPQAIGLGMTWDPPLVRQIAAIEAYEARYVFQSPKYRRGGLVVRAPNADLGRDPRWGRTEECYGEDPFFNGTMAVAFTRGLQGDDPRYWMTASLLKHFLANSNEDGRESSSSDFDERLWREYYSVPFRMAIVEGGSRAFMAAYNAYNGIPCHVHPMLQKIGRDEWGNDGIICTDGGGMRLLVTQHKHSPDLPHAAAACIKASIGQFLDQHREPTKLAVQQGQLSEAEIDAALRGNFRVMIKLGLLDPPERVPYSSIGGTDDPWLKDEHKALARVATQRSVVLLKNDGNLLPLERGKVKSIAVIGRRAEEVLLDWYSGTPPYVVSALEGIRGKAGRDIGVKFAASNGNDAAAKIARSCDVAVVVVGNHPTCDGSWEVCTSPNEGKEAIDRKGITLEDEELIKTVFAANPRTIVVLMASFPYAINWTAEHVPAIVHITHNSQELGNGLADVLFGDVNPAGRLVQTWPKSLDQLPPMMDYNIRNGRTYMYFKGEPLYPFGHGLSYTTFKYSDLRLSSDSLKANGSLRVSIDVRNTGGRAGDEVVQLYVRHLDSAVARPIQELRGFQRVQIDSGATRTVELTLDASRLAYWNTDGKRFVVESGAVEILVGASSRDIRARRTISVVP